MINQKEYLTTGEFAKMMNITKETLFHYDKIGLFSPEIKLQNEYRYYSIYQIELLEVILMLRELGMPLKQIKESMDKRNPDAMLSLLEREEKEIEEKMRKLKAQKRMIKEQREQIIEAQKVDISFLGIKEFEERYYMRKRAESNEDKELFHQIQFLKKEFEKAKVSWGYTVGFFQYKQDVQEGEYSNYHDVVLIMKQASKKLKYQILPAGEYLVAYHKGHWNKIQETYERMFAYIEERQLETEDVFLETYVIDRLLVEEYQEYVTEISVRIKKTDA